MLPSVAAPTLRIPIGPLDQSAFSSFGTVVENPARSPARSVTKQNVVSANQGSALKYIDVSNLTDYYGLAPSGKPAKVVMNMFVCSPRELKSPALGSTSSCVSNTNAPDQSEAGLFPVKILERHPFTSQTFIPVGLEADDTTTAYLVIVAPTLPTSSGKSTDRPAPYPQHSPRRRRSIMDIFSKARESLFTDNNQSAPESTVSVDMSSQCPKGPGEPDLSQVKAFLARGSQAVTYGPGTWHAPMVVLGSKSIDFVVVQYANGVGLEDCQEVLLGSGVGTEGLDVLIGGDLLKHRREKAKL